MLVSSSTSFHSAAGVTVVPNELSDRNLEILVPNGSMFTHITGTPVPGGWQFTGVPPGMYYLKSGRTYFVTDAREVELDAHRLGRADTVPSNVSRSPLQLNLTNLAPWMPYLSRTEPGSSLQLASGQVNLGGMVELFEDVPAGQTELVTNQAQMWNTIGRIPIFEADKGDRLYVNQLSQLDAGTLPDGGALAYSTVVRSVQMDAFDFTADGMTPLPATGRLEPVPQMAFTLDWRLSAYTGHATAVHPLATPDFPSFYVFPSAYGLDHGWVGDELAEVLSLQLPPGASFELTRPLTYGNPYPSTWGMVGYAQYAFRIEMPIPDGSGSTYDMLGTMLTHERLEDLVAAPVQPRVSPPRSLTIDGVDATVSRELSSVTPIVAWQPPTLGTPTAYRVGVYQYTGSYYAPLKGYVYVPGSVTQVRLPPGMLSPDSIHYLRLTVVDAPHYDVSRQSSVYLLPSAQADTFSSFFTTP